MTLKDDAWPLHKATIIVGLIIIAIAAAFRIGESLMPREPATYYICIQEPGVTAWQCSEHTDDTHPTTAPRSWPQRVDPPAEALVHATPQPQAPRAKGARMGQPANHYRRPGAEVGAAPGRNMMLTDEKVTDLIQRCHQAAVDGGWWHDLHTGERLERNRAELLCLIHSEISEGYDADMFEEYDDKLPHRKGAEVELADALIRACDYAGGLGYTAVAQIEEPWRVMTWASLHSRVSKIMELERKNKPGVNAALRVLMSAIVLKGTYDGWDVLGALEEKVAFNAQRPDHKPENRLAADGKKF